MPRVIPRVGSLLLSIALAGSVWLGADVAGAEQGEGLFEGLIPGTRLSDTELREFYGTGVTTSSRGESGSASASSSGSLSDRNLREVLMGAFGRAGIRPPLAPSGPNGTAGGGPLPDLDRALPSIDVPQVSVPSIKVPSVRVPSMPLIGGSSSSSSGSWSSSSF